MDDLFARALEFIEVLEAFPAAASIFTGIFAAAVAAAIMIWQVRVSRNAQKRQPVVMELLRAPHRYGPAWQTIHLTVRNPANAAATIETASISWPHRGRLLNTQLVSDGQGEMIEQQDPPDPALCSRKIRLKIGVGPMRGHIHRVGPGETKTINFLGYQLSSRRQRISLIWSWSDRSHRFVNTKKVGTRM